MKMCGAVPTLRGEVLNAWAAYASIGKHPGGVHDANDSDRSKRQYLQDFISNRGAACFLRRGSSCSAHPLFRDVTVLQGTQYDGAGLIVSVARLADIPCVNPCAAEAALETRVPCFHNYVLRLGWQLGQRQAPTTNLLTPSSCVLESLLADLSVLRAEAFC